MSLGMKSNKIIVAILTFICSRKAIESFNMYIIIAFMKILKKKKLHLNAMQGDKLYKTLKTAMKHVQNGKHIT